MRSLSKTGEDSEREARGRDHRIFPSLGRSAATRPLLCLPRISRVTKIRPLPYAGDAAAKVPSERDHTRRPVRLSIACKTPLFFKRKSLPSAIAGGNSVSTDPGYVHTRQNGGRSCADAGR